jgi:hypothetical protein
VSTGPTRLYTLAEANARLAEMTATIARLRDLRDEMRGAQELIDILWQRLESGEPVLAGLGERQRDLDALVEEFSLIVRDVDASGIIIRDLDQGLVDFPARLRGKPVFLCWKTDERQVEFWHGTTEGFAGRKPVSSISEW